MLVEGQKGEEVSATCTQMQERSLLWSQLRKETIVPEWSRARSQQTLLWLYSFTSWDVVFGIKSNSDSPLYQMPNYNCGGVHVYLVHRLAIYQIAPV